MLHAGERARLSGMVITGSISADGNGTELHRDESNVIDCSGKYTNQSYPACLDIIMIPVFSDQSWRYVKISTTNYLMLCEVEVFAGKHLFICSLYMHLVYFNIFRCLSVVRFSYCNVFSY